MADTARNSNNGLNEKEPDAGFRQSPNRSPRQKIPAKFRRRLLILAILTAVSVFSSCLCLSISWLSFAQSASQVQQQYRAHPVVVEKIGGIDQCRFQLTHTLNETNRYNNGITYMVYAVRGPTGSGLLICGQAPGTLAVSEARLRQDGIDYDLD
jgi:hypothetical protein